jgi:hypothetical protein
MNSRFLCIYLDLNSANVCCNAHIFFGPYWGFHTDHLFPQVAVLHSASVGSHKRSLEPTPLGVVPSANMKGLQLSKRLEKSDVALTEAMGSKPPLVVGTIRMGFGHHR